MLIEIEDRREGYGTINTGYVVMLFYAVMFIICCYVRETLFAGRACNEFLQDVPLIGHLPLFIARDFFWRTLAERAAKPREGTFSPTYRSNGQGSGWGWG